jgi:uncharacterized membrane protein
MKETTGRQILARIVALANAIILGIVPVLVILSLIANGQFALQFNPISIYFFPLTIITGVYGWVTTMSISLVIMALGFLAWNAHEYAFKSLIFVVILTRFSAAVLWIGFAQYETTGALISRWTINAALVFFNLSALYLWRRLR